MIAALCLSFAIPEGLASTRQTRLAARRAPLYILA